MAELREADKDLLELTALEVPWSMVCGDLHCAFGSVEALARRILLLEVETTFHKFEQTLRILLAIEWLERLELK